MKNLLTVLYCCPTVAEHLNYDMKYFPPAAASLLQDCGFSPGEDEVARLLVPDRRVGEHRRGEAGQSGGVLEAEAGLGGGHTLVGP